MTITDRDFDLIIRKYGFETRNSGDLLAWFVHEGKVVVLTRRSYKRGDLPMQHSIRQQLKLTEDELADAINCTLDLDGYVAVLQRKGVI